MTERTPSPDPLFLAFQLALAGRYSIDRELGRGGMGVVYLAREVHLDRLVAIKLLPPELSVQPALRDRFLREARLAAKLSHPHIIPIHAVDETDGFVYYVMAYVDGETLAHRVQARGPLSASDGIRLLREAAWALGHAHGQGLVHRDVKPDNILIEASSGRALVADFGIAAAMGDAQTVAANTVSGTPEFMSPEQALGERVDARSDLYSLGATAFYALSGRLPFAGRSITEIIARQVTESAPPLASIGSTVPRKLASIVDRCLAKDPGQRPQSAQVLADQLGVAIEQRRELPAALRAFVKRDGRMDGGGTLLALTAGLLGSIATSAVAGPAAGVMALGAVVALAPVVFGITAARRLLGLGFAHADLAPAFRAEQESSREERSVHRGWLRSSFERTFRTAASVSASTAAVLLPIALSAPGTTRFEVVGVLAFIGVVIAACATLAHLALVQLRRDVDVEFWSAAWTGRAGMLAFSVARRLRGSKPVGQAMTHRATELSLGIAAEQLYASLPRASREMLGELPVLLERLQEGARVLRTRHDALQDAVVRDGQERADAGTGAVREERDVVSARLRETVGALETIRLNLLRLHAGSMTLESLTLHLEQAAEASADVKRLIAAHQEVADVLQWPKPPTAPTSSRASSYGDVTAYPHDIELTPV